MTTQELIDYYASLLILQYLQKPKAYATIQAVVTPALLPQASDPTLPFAVQNGFDLTTAVGVQLDVLGKYVGVTRNGNTFQGPITLDDTDFSILIRLAIFQNNAGSSLYDIQQLIANFFPGQILVFDYRTMRISYFLSVGSKALVEMILEQHILPKPMGVQLGTTIYAPIINAFFGFRTYQLPGANNEPFNTYADYNMAWPFLTYADAIII